jgi:hypothetical protein
MGAAGRSRVLQRYSWASVARSTADCYAEAVANWKDARC